MVAPWYVPATHQDREAYRMHALGEPWNTIGAALWAGITISRDSPGDRSQWLAMRASCAASRYAGRHSLPWPLTASTVLPVSPADLPHDDVLPDDKMRSRVIPGESPRDRRRRRHQERIDLLGAGWSLRAIAHHQGITLHAIRSWRGRYKDALGAE